MKIIKIFIAFLKEHEKIIYPLFVLVITGFLLSVWFKQQTILATAEEGIPFYNILRTLQLYSSLFYDTGLGMSGVFNISRVPLFFLLSLVQQVGLVPWQLQMFLYWILLIIPLLALPRLLKELFTKSASYVGYIAAIFYLFNLYSLSQVWTRFVLSLVILWSYLPLFLLLWILYINTQKLKYLIFLLISSLIFSDVYLLISPIITLWVCPLVYVSLFLIGQNNKLQIIKSASIAILSWIIVHLWWIIPLWKLRNDGYGASLDSSANMISLREVSKYFTNRELLTLQQKFIFSSQGREFSGFYEMPLIRELSYCIVLIVIVGLISSMRYVFSHYSPQRKKIVISIISAVKKTIKNNDNLPYVYFLALLSIGWFVSKGTNFPFGESFYTILFRYVSILQIFRNPYEKFGVVYMFAYTVFFALGVEFIRQRYKKVAFIVLPLIICLTCGYMVKPMWTGELFNSQKHIVVPQYYSQANNFIENQDKTDARILQLPFLRSSSISFDWGYTGEEPSEFLFDKASISRLSTNKFQDEFYLDINKTNIFRNINFPHLLTVMNVKYIILHSDRIISPYYQESFAETKEIINHWQGVNEMKRFGKLDIYSVLNSHEKRIYISNHISQVKNLDNAFNLMIQNNFNPLTDSFVVTTQNNNIEFTPNDNFKMPSYKITRQSSTHYQVEISENTGKFVLILANNFSKSWTATINNEIISTHFIVNGFANGWVINKKGNYIIDISFNS